MEQMELILHKRKKYQKPAIKKRMWWEVNEAGCWIVTSHAPIKPDGYIGIQMGGRKNRKQYTAHRMMFEIFNGPIPNGKQVCHHCDNPPCVNPQHLFAGTQKDNMIDMTRKGRRFIPKTYTHLTETQVKEIRESKESARKLAERYPASWRHIHNIKKGLYWKGVK